WQDIINFINSGSNSGTSGIGREVYMVDLFRNYNHSGSKPLYPAVEAPVYSMNGGSVPVGFNLGMTNPNGSGVIYFTTDGSDPRLAGGGVSPSAGIAGASVSLTSSGSVKARVLQTGTWSALNDFGFIVGIAGSASSIVVSELHYNPTGTAADTFPDKDDYEFIELLNLSTTNTVELTGVHFTNGITFTFTGSNVPQLLPGGRVVVVKKLAAFIERYPAVSLSLVAGEFTGSLENSGERITLLDATDASIKDFVYDDQFPWPGSPDGDGYSLVLNCDTANPDHNLAVNWRSHAMLHGNPGGPDGESWADFVAFHGLSGVLTADSDLDGTSDYEEYIFGTDPNDKDSDSPTNISLQTVFVDGMFQEFLTITVQRNLNAGEVLIIPEFTTDLLIWKEADIIMFDAVNQGDGTELISWRTTLPAFDPAKDRCFMRLRIEGK
ncbi:MAG: lamin tail domain-containing protein, partial [Roseibacillus sp.]